MDKFPDEWTSWRQQVACLTTCVQGFERQTIDCCTTGDNKICFDLPWNSLNESVGKCAGFCERRDAILCRQPLSLICGSDGSLYPNSCEWTKMRCVDRSLIQKDIQFCQTLRTKSHMEQNNTNVVSLSSTESLPLSFPTSALASTNISSVALEITTTTSPQPPTLTTRRTPQTTSKDSSTKVITPKTTISTPVTSTDMSTTLISTQSALSSLSSIVTSLAVSSSVPTTPSYCQNRHSISCGFTFNVVCGSDRQLYANLCMLALGRCDDPSLTQKDRQYCSSG
ncbi:uncharacterized protein LOC132717564 [Ruditapes philippinarum]|uniref:uncharacterized protein LOC132717564 n=1 Tax=Ruditapes philippinarum TaxID=129788 RepID=UPI00295BD21B|nr:uncharacterized protein LOC132717564 [Ruditapes philippinarum]